MSIELITILLFAALIITLAAGVPLAFGLGGIAFFFIIFIWGPDGLSLLVMRAIAQMRTIPTN